MKELFANTFNNLNVLLTGHTGFKGSWLTIWLKEMGANVVGFSLPEPPTIPNNYELAGLNSKITDTRGDIRLYEVLRETIALYKPELIIHFAAQTTVLPSYLHPKDYMDTNVGGTVNVLEAVRTSESVKALVVCATDKVYENREWLWGYRENDRLGGHDPYSTSKAMAELAVTAFRQSFFKSQNTSLPRKVIGSVRSGNVIGGGDFTDYGLIADAMRSLLRGDPIPLRNPFSIRPWLYVLEPLSGYLWLAAHLLRDDGQKFAEAWNFGPLQHKGITTQALIERLIAYWGSGTWEHLTSELDSHETQPHEARNLHLNWDKAAALLDWRPVYSIEEALAETVQWYRAYHNKQDIYSVCQASIQRYVMKAQELGLAWTVGKQQE